jgi:hypothetical protein
MLLGAFRLSCLCSLFFYLHWRAGAMRIFFFGTEPKMIANVIEIHKNSWGSFFDLLL